MARAQALLEFHCANPLAAQWGAAAAAAPSSYGAQLRLFEAFWQSGAPRLGEEGAAGWAAWFR